MTRHRRLSIGRIGKFLRRRDGTAIIAFALLLVPLTLSVGMAIDVGRVYVATQSLQSVADAAALAGATVFSDNTQQSKAITTAKAYFAKGILTLPSQMVVSTPVVTATAAPVCTAGAAETLTVTATATVNTSLMKLVAPNVPITATATAANPLTLFSFNVTGFDFSGSAGDLDGLYWFVVPDDSPHPPPQNLNLVTTNMTQTAPSNTTACIGATTKIGFAFSDSTSAKYYFTDHTGYGATYGNTYYYYSTTFPPAIEAFPQWPYDSALQIVDVNADGSYPQPSWGLHDSYLPETGPYDWVAGLGYFPANAEPLGTYAANGWVTCAGLQGHAIHLYWNDMGGYPDDFNYADGEITFQCASSQVLPVYLKK